MLTTITIRARNTSIRITTNIKDNTIFYYDNNNNTCSRTDVPDLHGSWSDYNISDNEDDNEHGLMHSYQRKCIRGMIPNLPLRGKSSVDLPLFFNVSFSVSFVVLIISVSLKPIDR